MFRTDLVDGLLVWLSKEAEKEGKPALCLSKVDNEYRVYWLYPNAEEGIISTNTYAPNALYKYAEVLNSIAIKAGVL